MEKTIEQLAAAYLQAKDDAEKKKAQQDELGAILKCELIKIGGIINVSGTTIKLQNKESISFDDAILPYLKTNGLQTYVRESIDEAGLKKAIKKSEILAKQLKPFTITKESQSLITSMMKE